MLRCNHPASAEWPDWAVLIVSRTQRPSSPRLRRASGRTSGHRFVPVVPAVGAPRLLYHLTRSGRTSRRPHGSQHEPEASAPHPSWSRSMGHQPRSSRTPASQAVASLAASPPARCGVGARARLAQAARCASWDMATRKRPSKSTTRNDGSWGINSRSRPSQRPSKSGASETIVRPVSSVAKRRPPVEAMKASIDAHRDA